MYYFSPYSNKKTNLIYLFFNFIFFIYTVTRLKNPESILEAQKITINLREDHVTKKENTITIRERNIEKRERNVAKRESKVENREGAVAT